MTLFSTTRKLAVFLIGIFLSNLSHAAFTQVISFGDSLSDTGNVFQATGADPALPNFKGRFSNGPVWNEILATSLGLAVPTPSLLGGTNYAWGEARTNLAFTWADSLFAGGGATADVIVPSTATQVADFISDVGGSADPDALYTIWTGSNDFLDVASSIGEVSARFTADTAKIASLVNDLKAVGAQSVLVLNLPNLGLVPRAGEQSVGASALSNIFNARLKVALDGISGVELVDIYAGSNAIAADPDSFGLSNVTEQCILLSASSDCSSYLFWDDIHPTTAGHVQIASLALERANLLMPVPLPSAFPLMISTLVGMGLFRRKRIQQGM